MSAISNVIILNGPPDSGKDKSADYIVEKYGYKKLEMKGALRRLAHKIAALYLPVTMNTEDFCWSLENDKVMKDEYRATAFGNRTWRQFLIYLSEEVCKPIFGNDIFSLAAHKAILDSGSDRIVFSDGGFQIEYDTLVSLLPKTPVTLVHVHRDGCAFTTSKAKDSRRYITPSQEQRFFTLTNIEGDFENSHKQLDHIIRVTDPYRHMGLDL